MLVDAVNFFYETIVVMESCLYMLVWYVIFFIFFLVVKLSQVGVGEKKSKSKKRGRFAAELEIWNIDR